MTHISITSGALTATIDSLGAELLSLTDAQGREYMTDGDPRWWTGHAPVLFPIVGRLRDDTYRLDGREYRLEKHGFARKSAFDVVAESDDAVSFRLADSDATRAVYPFAFTLDMRFALHGMTLAMTATVSNPNGTPMPFSFGFHPAFAWPLPGGGEKLAHQIAFQHDEPEDVWRIDAQALLARAEPTPVRGDRLALRPELFEDDALIWTDLASRALVYRGMNGAALEIAFPDCPNLGVWQKPGAPYIAIEPWHGFNDPVDFTGDFRAKPGVIDLPPGETRAFRMDVTVRPA